MAKRKTKAELEQSRVTARAQHTATDINKIRRWQYLYSQGKLSKRQQKSIAAILEKERGVANRRMKRFSDTGQHSPAQKRALGKIEQQLGKGRKTWGKAKSFEDLLMNAGSINAFVRSEQSTITGAKKYRAQKIAEFRSNPKFSEWAGKYSDDQIEQLLQLMHNESMADYFDFFSSYDEEVEKIASIIEEDSGREWLMGKLKAYEEFVRETERLDNPFHNKGISTRELKALINTKYQRKEHRRRK